jgi:hypothetical protein
LLTFNPRSAAERSGVGRDSGRINEDTPAPPCSGNALQQVFIFKAFFLSRFFLGARFDPQGAASSVVRGDCPAHPLLFEHRVLRAHDVVLDWGSRFGRNAPHLTDDRLAPDQLQRRAAFHPAAKSDSLWKLRFMVG